MFLAFHIVPNTNKKSGRLRIHAALSLTAIVILIALMAACGGGSGGGGGGMPGQTLTITIQGVSQNFQHLTSVQLVVD
jgi:hypothetical protein